MLSVLTDFSNALANMSRDVSPSLVQVRRGSGGAGAGAIWHADGLIVTNAHVVSEHHRIRGRRRMAQQSADLRVVLHDGRELAAQVLAADHDRDLAALRVDAHDLTPIRLGDSRKLQAGDVVLAMGFPWGVAGGATTGIIIGTGAAVPNQSVGTGEWIAASLHLRPGHSGGPLVDAQGRLVGINTMMNGPDVGVAVPVHVAVEFLKRVLVSQV